ncbi:MAG TPA: Holliday junction branch migration protein RuvA, partial [Rhodospirillum rubrum]|nr:Holliday junction branch migration protein RuvA [Rhodospirillum rubrum]
DVLGDAVSALVNLGYGRSEAVGAASRAAGLGATTVQGVIGLALRDLGRGGA